MPQHNEYFCNAKEGQSKAAEWVGYIFPIPLLKQKNKRKDYSCDFLLEQKRLP